MQFDSVDQVSLRLKGSLALYKNELVKIVGVLDKDVVQVCGFDDDAMNQLVRLSSEDFNYTNFKLGYMKSYEPGRGSTALYVSRSPLRQQRQGLILNALSYVCVGAGNVVYTKGLQGRFQYKNLQDCLNNVHTPFDEAVDILDRNGDVDGISISRRVALRKDKELGFFVLEFKGVKIGWGDPSRFNIPSEFLYLKEVIEKSGVKVR